MRNFCVAAAVASAVAVQADQIRARMAAGEKPTRLARELRIARSSVHRTLAA
jgi:hypothetical protein